jgi:hypothetical protein
LGIGIWVLGFGFWDLPTESLAPLLERIDQADAGVFLHVAIDSDQKENEQT